MFWRLIVLRRLIVLSRSPRNIKWVQYGTIITDEHQYGVCDNCASQSVKGKKRGNMHLEPQTHSINWLKEEERRGKTLSVACICSLAIFILTSVYAANSNLAESLLCWFLSARLCLFALLSAVASPQHLNTASGINRTERRKGGEGKKKSWTPLSH